MNHDPLDNSTFDSSAEQEAQEALREAQRLAAEVEKGDWQWLLHSRRGRRLVYRFLSGAGLYRTSFVEGEPYRTAFNEGSRNVGLQILAMLKAVALDNYLLMLSEAEEPDGGPRKPRQR